MLRILSLLGMVFLLNPISAQQLKAAAEDNGYLDVSRGRVSWPSPDSIVRDLRSTDETVRLNAIGLMAAGQLSHTPVYSKDGKVVGQVVSIPGEVSVRYAALGDDDTKIAVVTMSLLGVYVYAAVAIPQGPAWERIATLNCWCKYEHGDLMQHFISLYPAPFHGDPVSRFELVAHGSGGGTGLYSQQEARFRVYRGELRRVLYFESRSRSCPPGPEPRFCDLRAKWMNNDTLIESRGRIQQQEPEIYLTSPEVENEVLRVVHCTAYQWDEIAFTYKRSAGTPPQCEAISAH